MFLYRITDFILQSRVQAMALAFVLAFIPYIGGLGIIIAALVTLRRGLIEGAYVTLAATLPFVIKHFMSSIPPEMSQLAMVMMGVLVLGNVLTWIFAEVLREYGNWSFTLEVSAFIGILAIALVHLMNPDIQNWWSSQLNTYFAKSALAMEKVRPGSQEMTADIQQQVVSSLKQFATGLLVMTLLFNSVIQVMLARGWQAYIFNPGGLRKELYAIRLSHFTGALLFVILILAYLGNDLAIDLLPVIITVFFVAGLSVIHSLLQQSKNNWLWLVLIYAGIIWMLPSSFFMVSLIALLDTGINFRKRFNF